MEIDEFRANLLDSVRVSAEAYKDFRTACFVKEACQRLSDAEEFSDFEPCHFEGIGPKGRKLLVDGYAFDEIDNSMVLVVGDYSDADEMPSLGLAEIKRYFGMLRAYIEESISGKMTDNKNGIEETELGWGLAHDLFTWSNKIDRFKLYLVSDSQLVIRSKDLSDENIANIPVELHVWDILRFHKAYQSSSGRDDLEINFEEMGQPIPFLKAGGSEGEYVGFLCMIPGEILSKIYERYGGRLLEGNVRSFLTLKGGVNKGIRNTILNKPSMFFAYNNGITATAEDVKFDVSMQNIISATNLQIVNGGQTTASLALAFRKDGSDLSKVFVQMKLSVLPGDRAATLIPDIAKYANSQNKVNDADFFSNHPYHIRLEEFSRRLGAPATNGTQHKTYWFYERARGQYDNSQSRLTVSEKNAFKLTNPRSQLLKKTDIAKLENTWRGIPHKVSLGSEKNFRLFAEWITPLWEQDPTKFHEEYFKQIIARAILFKTTEQIVSEQPWYQSGYRANIVTYSLAKLRDMITNQCPEFEIDLRRIWDRQSVSPELMLLIASIAKAVFDILTAIDRPKENVTEWAKMELCWLRVKGLSLDVSEQVIQKLTPLENTSIENRLAKKVQREDDSIAIQTSVFNFGGDKWAQIRKWAEDKSLLSPKESSLLSIAAAIPLKIPSDKQCIALWTIKDKLEQEGCPFLA